MKYVWDVKTDFESIKFSNGCYERHTLIAESLVEALQKCATLLQEKELPKSIELIRVLEGD